MASVESPLEAGLKRTRGSWHKIALAKVLQCQKGHLNGLIFHHTFANKRPCSTPLQDQLLDPSILAQQRPHFVLERR